MTTVLVALGAWCAISIPAGLLTARFIAAGHNTARPTTPRGEPR